MRCVWTTCVFSQWSLSHGVWSTPDGAGVVVGQYVSCLECRARATCGAIVGRRCELGAARRDADEHESLVAVHARRDPVRRIQSPGWPARWERTGGAELV